MTDYQERRAQYLRDAHDWAEDDLPDASADYTTVTVEADAGEFTDALDEVNTNLAYAAQIRKAYQRGYEQGRDDERADIINRVHELAFGDEEGNLWGVYDFIVGIREEEHVGWRGERPVSIENDANVGARHASR